MKDQPKSEQGLLSDGELLRREVSELRRRLEEKELQLLHFSEALEERKKELWCHNRISHLMDDDRMNSVELFSQVAAIIPQAFQYSNQASALLQVRGVNYYSPGYRESDLSLSADIRIRAIPAGFIRVSYIPEGIRQTNPVFLPEEKEFLEGVCSRLAAYLEKTDHSQVLGEMETESRKLSESLAGEAYRFKRLFERMAQGVVYQDAGGRIFLANPAAEEMLGLTLDQMQGRTSIDPRWKAIREDGSDFPGAEHPAMEALKTGRPLRNVVMGVFHPVQERYKWILVSAEPEYKEDESLPFQVYSTFTDITDLKNTELELEENRRFMADLIENSGSMVYVKDLDGKYILVNKRWEVVTGISRDISRNKTDAEIFDPVTSGLFVRNDGQVIESGAAKRMEETIYAPSGPRYFISVKFPVRDREGKVNGLCGISMEVTDRKKAELDLRKSEEKYRSLIESSDAAIYMVDADGTYLYLNQIAAKPFGLPPDVLTGKRVDQLMKPGDARKIINDVRLVISGSKGMILESEVDIAGERRWYRISVRPVRDEKGDTFAAMVHATDITDNKLAEEKVKASVQRYKTLFYTSPVAYLIIQDGKFTDCNQASEQLIRGDRSMIIGKTPAMISPEFQPEGKRSDELSAEIMELAYRKGSHSFEWILSRSDCSEFLSHTSLTAMELDGNRVLLANWQDITVKNKAEEQIRKLSQAVEQSPVSILITDLQGVIEYANPKACETTGYTLDELRGRMPHMLKSGETSPWEYETLWETITGGSEWKGLFHNKRKNGELYWESCSIAPISDEDGKITHFLAVKEDITAKKKMEETLAANESRLREIAEQSRSVIWEVDREGKFTYVSPVSELVYGYPPDELTRLKYFWDIQPEHVQEDMKIWLKGIISRGEKIRDYVNPVLRKDGRQIWVSTNGTPLYDESRNIVGYLGADSDVTEKKLAVEELAKFRTISEQANYGTAIVDMEGTLLYVNEAFARKHGWSTDELTGKSLVFLYNDGQLDRIRELLQLIQTNGEFKAQEVWQSRKDGTEFPALMTAKVIYDFAKTPQFISATVTDISENKAQEEKIKHQNDRLNAIINAMPDKIFVQDAEGNFLEYYTHDPDQLLVPKDKLIGMNLRDLFDTGTAELNLRKIQECLREQKLVMHEFIVQQADRVIHFEVRIVPMGPATVLRFVRDITDKKNAELQVLDLNVNLERKVQKRTRQLEKANQGLIREVAERERTESELKQISEELERFFSVALDLLCIGDSSGRFLKLNKSWETITGFSVEELQRLNFMDLVHPDDKIETTEKMKALISRGSIVGFTNRYRTKEGEYRNIEWHAVVVGDRIYAAARDVTTRIRLAQTLMENIEREKDLNEMKSRFVSVASHEFRTPLAAILMTSETLLNYWKRMDEEKIEARLKTIIGQVQHLGSIVANVMQVSKIQEGKMSFEPGEVELVNLCREVIHEFNVSHDHPIEFSSNFDEVWVKADRRLLLQSMTNLISNALKYAQPDPRVKVRILVNEDQLLISVEDNGIGIPESDRQKLFQPFFRAANASRFEGNGLGLNIVRESIRMHGGEVRFESRVNQGTVFFVQLPKTIILK